MPGARSGVRTLGKYRPVAELARGGMGVIYLALMRGPGSFSKLLALKELKPDVSEDPTIVAVFVEEARLAACLSHPNVVQTIEAGSEGDRHYIAMEYLDGQSLHRVIGRARRNGVPVPFALQGAVLCCALEGLAYAHAAADYDGRPLGIVHRDMSPHNVFIGYDGQVKVLDFGIAKAQISEIDTHTELLKGKIAYMAPEQAAGMPVDARTDLFPVGVMLWEAATGRRFWWEIGSDMQILRGLLRGDLEGAHERAILEAPEDLRAIIRGSTSFDPSQRYPSAALVLADLRAALAGRGAQAFGPREIGGFLHELFGEDRAHLQAAIDDALGRGSHSEALSVSEVRPRATGAEMPALHTRVAPSTRRGLQVRTVFSAWMALVLGTVAAVGGLVALRLSPKIAPAASQVSSAPPLPALLPQADGGSMTDAGTDAGASIPCTSVQTDPNRIIFVTGSTALRGFIQEVSKVLATQPTGAVTVVYQSSGSCFGVKAAIDPGNNLMVPSAGATNYYDANGQRHAALIPVTESSRIWALRTSSIPPVTWASRSPRHCRRTLRTASAPCRS